MWKNGEPEVEQARRYGLAVDEHVPLDQVPAPRTRDEDRGLLVQAVGLLTRVELDRAPDRVGEVPLALDDVLPGRRHRVFEVGHEDARPRVHRVDRHLAVERAGDLHAAVA